MNEELEWLKEFGEQVRMGLPDDVYFEYVEKLAFLGQALTPPTADEVCKALSEYIKRDNDIIDVHYRVDKREFYYSWQHSTQTLAKVIVLFIYGGLSFSEILPPHLITMIGRFYEGVNIDE